MSAREAAAGRSYRASASGASRVAGDGRDGVCQDGRGADSSGDGRGAVLDTVDGPVRQPLVEAIVSNGGPAFAKRYSARAMDEAGFVSLSGPHHTIPGAVGGLDWDALLVY